MSAASSTEPGEPRIVVLSGPSGSGKTTIVERLLQTAPVKLIKAVSATTRNARPGEVEADHYYFLSHDEFQSRRAAGEFVECFEVHQTGNWYGTLRAELQRARQAGAWALLEIDVQGAQKIAQEYPQTVTIFLTASSQAEFEKRLRARGTESEEAIQRRLRTASDELRNAGWYRHRVVNDNLDAAVREIGRILQQAESQVV